MSRQIDMYFNLKEAYIIKHALRDKTRDEDEEKLYLRICEEIKNYKICKHIK